MNALEELACLGFSGNDGGFAGLSFSHSIVSDIEAQFAFASVLVHTMALETVLGENRTHLPVEVDYRGLSARGVGTRRRKHQKKQGGQGMF